MRPEKKTEFTDKFEKLLSEFLARFKVFKSHEYLFEIFSRHSMLTLTKHQLIFKWKRLISKRGPT